MRTGRWYLFRRRVRYTRTLLDGHAWVTWRQAWQWAGLCQRMALEMIAHDRADRAAFEAETLADIGRLPEIEFGGRRLG